MRALILIVPVGHLVLVVATATYSRDRTGSGAFKSWIGGHDAVVDWTDPIGLKGARVSACVFHLTDEPVATDTSDPLCHGRAHRGPLGPQLVPHPQQGLPRSRSNAELLRSRSSWRPSSRELGNSASNPLRCCLHLVAFDMQVSPCPMV